MIPTTRKQELEKCITQLIAAYRLAMAEVDRSDDVLTKAEVTRSIIDSGRVLANRLHTREQGIDARIQELEHYYQALHAEDWVEKSKSAIKTSAAIIGVTAGVLVSLVLDFLWALLEGSFNLFRYLLAYPAVFVPLMRWLAGAVAEYSKTGSNPSTARIILSRTVDPAEGQVYALIGGSRPVRTFERINQGVAIGVGLIGFVIACGFVLAVLQAF